MVTPDINFVRHRHLTFRPTPSVCEFLNQVGLTISGVALVSAIGGYGALMLGRSVPVALALSALGSVGAAANCKLREM